MKARTKITKHMPRRDNRQRLQKQCWTCETMPSPTRPGADDSATTKQLACSVPQQQPEGKMASTQNGPHKMGKREKTERERERESVENSSNAMTD